MIDHITIHVEPGTLANEDLGAFFALLGFEEVEPHDRFEHGWRVRWFFPFDHGRRDAPAVHLVESDDGEQGTPGLGHICISVGDMYDELRNRAHYLHLIERDSGSGRFWVAFNNIRFEVRP